MSSGLVPDYLAVGIDPSAGDDLRPRARSAAQPAAAARSSAWSALPSSRATRPSRRRSPRAGLPAMSALMFTYPVHQAADILFCKATSSRSARTSSRTSSSPDRSRAASTTATAPARRVPRARRAAQRRAGAARHRRPEDEQEPRQRDRASAPPPTRPRGSSRARRPTPSATSPTTPCTGPRSPTSCCSLRCAWTATRSDVADEIGDAGSAALKRLLTEAVNERFRAIRARRADLVADPGHLRDVLHDGNRRARRIAEQTLAEVRRLMHTDYAHPADSPR